jgi:hypothetical protein
MNWQPAAWRGALERHQRLETALIQEFAAHRIFENLGDEPRERVIEILLQRRFLSLAFTPMYDLAIDGLSDPRHKRVARSILHEEYPMGDRTTHREDLVVDLLTLGARREQITSCLPSGDTREAILELLAVLPQREPDGLYQIKLLTVLRFSCEVLVALEYERLWPRLHELGLDVTGPKQSVFYLPHRKHDGPTIAWTAESRLQPENHADELGACLTECLYGMGDEGFAFCIAIERQTTDHKTRFYNQFLSTA